MQVIKNKTVILNELQKYTVLLSVCGLLASIEDKVSDCSQFIYFMLFTVPSL